MRISGFTPFWCVGPIASVGIAAAIWCTSSAGVFAAAPPDAPVAAFLRQHCQQCHGETKPKARAAPGSNGGGFHQTGHG